MNNKKQVAFSSYKLSFYTHYHPLEKGREVKKLQKNAVLLIMGLCLILAGGTCLFEPFRIVTAQQQFSKEVGPGVFNNIDLPLNISHGQSVKIAVKFDERAESDQREVWPLIFYMFPTKGVVETVARFVNQSETSFIMGWENASFLNVFITGFVIRVFYHGSPAVVANFTIVRLENPTKVVGIGLLYASAIPLWFVIILSRRKTSPNLNS